MTIDLQQIADLGLRGDIVPRELSQALLEDEGPDVLPMAQAAGQIRMATFGRKVKLHQINNIQNGLCPEDCGYCGQSKISDAPLNKYPIKSEDEIVAEAHAAKVRGAYRYCMVASGRGPTDNRINQLAHTVKRINQEVGIRTCLSVGIVSKEHAQVLRDAGLDRLNHNLNTSAKHTPNIVTTHTYDDRIQTLRDAKSCGLEICSGIITGMGESNQDILDVAYELRDLDARSIPINFLIPIPGNPLYDFNQLSPTRCLRILCAFRFINPTAEIRIGGGREGHLRSLQALALYPANSLFIEGYLVTRGDKVDTTIQMILDAGFEIDGDVDVDADISSAEKYQIDQDPNILNPKTTVTG